MNTRFWSIAIALIGLAAVAGCVTTYPVYQTVPMGGPAESPAPVVEAGGSDQPFYDDLAPYGRWVYVSGPGWVWSPYGVQAGWRPYQLGHWVYTDYGWTWSSDEDWGWAVYHYGRWHQDPGYGWVWVPGTEWGPAWVAWNEGGGYVGWAPLPWQVHVQAGVGITSASLNVSIAPAWWCFVSARNLVDVRLNTYIVPQARNVTLIQVTKNVTNYTYVDNRIVNGGVRVETIGRAVGRTIPRYRVSEATDVVEASRGRGNGRDIPMYRPDPRGRHQSNRREVPPGHSDEMERMRQMRHGVETPPAPPQAPQGPDAPPGQTQTDPPRDNRKPQENRGRKWLDAFTGQPQQRGRSPQSNRPQQAPPAPPAAPGQTGNPSDQGTAPPSAPPSAPSQPSTPPPDSARTSQGDQHRATPPAATTPKDRGKEIREAAEKAKPKKQDPKKNAPDEDKDKKDHPDSNN